MGQVQNFNFLFIFFFLLSGCHLFNERSDRKNNKNTLTIAWESSPRTIDPRFAVDANSQYLEDLVHCSLITFNPQGTPTPSVAANLPQWLGPTTLVVKIRSDVQFSGGQKLSSEDVAATYRYFLQKSAKPSPRAGAFAKITSVKAIDSQTVEFKLSEPDASFISNLVVGILPAALAQGPEVASPEQMIGCGPFSIVGLDVTHVLLARNPHFTLEDPPPTESIEIKIIKNEKTRFSKLRKGEIDVVQNILNRDLIPMIERKFPQLSVTHAPGLKTTYLGFNMRDKILKNPEVRLAIGMAIDREALIKYLLGGLAIPATTMLPPGNPYTSNSLTAIPFNLQEADRLLDQAGFPRDRVSGTRFSISYKTTTDVSRINIAKAIAAQLLKVGIHVIVEPMEWGRFKMDIEKGNVQLWSLTWIGFKDPDIYRYAFATESFPPNGGNRGWYTNQELDQLLTEARQETDFVKRTQLYYKAQELIHRELPYVFLWHEENFVVMQKSVQDFKLYADGRYSSLKQAHK